MTHKEFFYWLEGFLHDKKITSYDEAANLLPTIKDKMEQVKDEKPVFPKISRTIDPSPFNPIIMPLKQEDDPYKPPFTITCETKQQLND